MELSNIRGHHPFSLGLLTQGEEMTPEQQSKLGEALVMLFLGAVPLLITRLKSRIRRSNQYDRLSDRMEKLNLETREYVLTKAKEYEGRVADLERSLMLARRELNDARRNENAALDQLATMSVQLRLAQIEIRKLTERVYELEAQLRDAGKQNG